MVEAIGRKIGEGDLKPPLDNQEVIRAWQNGDVVSLHKLLFTEGVTSADIDEFLSNRWKLLEGAVYQKEPNYSGEADIGSPYEYSDSFLNQDPSATLSSEEEKDAGAMLGKAMMMSTEKGKAKAFGSLDWNSMTESEKQDMRKYEDTLAELDYAILEAQFTQEAQTKQAEIDKQMTELVEKAKSGEIDALAVILGMTNGIVAKYGTEFSQLGEKMLYFNLQSTKETKRAEGLAGNALSQELMTIQNDLKVYNLNMQRITGDMNAITQQIQSVMVNGKNLIEIAQKFADATNAAMAKV